MFIFEIDRISPKSELVMVTHQLVAIASLSLSLAPLFSRSDSVEVPFIRTRVS